jgi:crossover junction endodeoxyribonuclease RuvC
MVILGLDPGTAATGYGVVRAEGSRLTALEFGCVRTDAGTPAEERLAVIARAVDEVLDRHAPDGAAIEEVYVGDNARNAIAIGQARGALLVTCGLRNVAVGEYSVAAIKTAVCGFGRADKTQVQRMVAALLGLDAPPTPDHAADALAAAICHLARTPLDRSLERAGRSR